MYQFYKMKIVNVYNQKAIREETYQEPDVILNFVENFEKTKNSTEEMYLFDSGMRTLLARYVSHSKESDGNTLIYKLFFKTRLSEFQFPVEKSEKKSKVN